MVYIWVIYGLYIGNEQDRNRNMQRRICDRRYLIPIKLLLYWPIAQPITENKRK